MWPRSLSRRKVCGALCLVGRGAKLKALARGPTACAARLGRGMLLLFACLALAFLSLDDMVTAGQHVIEQGTLEQLASRWQRFEIAMADTALSLEYGAYGEFPVRSMAEILQHPIVRETIDVGPWRDSVGLGGGARFVDYGSGAGRLCLAVAAMHDWGSVVGVEAMEQLHTIADTAARVAEQQGLIRSGVISSLHSGEAMAHEEPVASVLAQADLTFLYSTAFPSDDGLRLPRLSASLACVVREGALLVTADKWLVGSRFRFEALLTVQGENDEAIQAHIWRVVGPPLENFATAFAEVNEHWSGEDACADNERACHALLQALGEETPAEGAHGDEL